MEVVICFLFFIPTPSLLHTGRTHWLSRDPLISYLLFMIVGLTEYG